MLIRSKDITQKKTEAVLLRSFFVLYLYPFYSADIAGGVTISG